MNKSFSLRIDFALLCFHGMKLPICDWSIAWNCSSQSWMLSRTMYMNPINSVWPVIYRTKLKTIMKMPIIFYVCYVWSPEIDVCLLNSILMMLFFSFGPPLDPPPPIKGLWNNSACVFPYAIDLKSTPHLMRSNGMCLSVLIHAQTLTYAALVWVSTLLYTTINGWFRILFSILWNRDQSRKNGVFYHKFN